MDQVIEALRAERPAVPTERLVPDAAMCDAVVRHRRRRLSPFVPAVAAAAVTAVVLAGQVDIGRNGLRVTAPPPAAADVARIATTSAAAVRSSGRALLDFHVGQGTVAEQRGTGTVSFSGDDLEMHFAFQPAGTDRPGFEARNRTVDGQFYLWDAGRWVRDTNAGGTRGSDLFDADPRTLLAGLHPAAGFELVGTETVDGVALRRLRATRPADLRSLNLSFGPLDPDDIERLEVWVGADDIVRRLEVGTLQVEVRYAHSPTRLERSADGRRMVKTTDPPDPSTGVPVEIRSSYSVRFVDLGAPIAITAPPGAVDVAGQG